MILRRARTSSSGRRPCTVSRVAQGAGAVAIAVLPLLVGTHAGAQASPAAAGIADEVVRSTEASVGVVTVGKKLSVGWVAAQGVIVTSDTAAKEVGTSAQFTQPNSKAVTECYVGTHVAELRLSVLRCAQLEAPALKIESRYPSPGTPVFVVGLARKALLYEGGSVVANDVSFMGQKRLRLSFVVKAQRGTTPNAGVLEFDNVAGSPVIDATGRVVSAALVSPNAGGQALGLTSTELTSAVEQVLPLPESFTSAAIITGGKRALIPAAIGLVAGIAWGLLARNHTVVLKALGLTAVGVIGVVGYSVLSLMVVGPQALI